MGDNSELPPETTAAEVAQPGLRFLEMAVYIMGGLLVLMLLGLIGGIVWKVTHHKEAPPPETKVLDLGLAPGTQVQHLVLDGDRMAIDTGSEILVIDMRQNAIISRIKLGAR